MIIDNHCHLETENPPEKMIQAMDEGNVDKAVIFSATCENLPDIPEALLGFGRFLLQSKFDWIGRKIYENAVTSQPGKIKVNGKFFDIFHELNNINVAKVVQEYPDRFIGFVFLNPKNNPNVMEQFEQGIHDFGMQGVKIHPWFHNYDPADLLYDVASRCEKLKLPILIHMGSRPDSGNVPELISKFPKLKVILAHLGTPWFKRSWEQAKTNPNVYLDISGPYLSAPVVKKAVSYIGPDKIIFGTDAPYGLRTKIKGQLSYAGSKSWVETLPIAETDKEKIFSGNLLSIIG